MPRVHDSLLRPQRKLKLRGNFAVENGEFAITLSVIKLSLTRFNVLKTLHIFPLNDCLLLLIQPYTLMK